MFCTDCGKTIKDGARFCPFCGAEQTEAAPQPAARATGSHFAQPAGEAERPRRSAAAPQYRTRSGSAAPTRINVTVKKKKSPVGLIIALVLVLAILAGGGVLLYRTVIFPKNTVKNAEALVEYLRQSPARDNGEDFSRRIGFHDKDYYAILHNQEAELKIKDYLRELYGRGDYHGWAHALYMLQSCGLYGSMNEVPDIVERRDIEDLYSQGWSVNLDYGWFSDYDHVNAVYSDSPGFRDPENFDVYIWGDVMAVRGHEYGWNLFYRGYKLDVWGETRASSTSAEAIQELFRNSRQFGDLLIFPYDDGLVYDNYYVLDTSTGDYFTGQYDF